MKISPQTLAFIQRVATKLNEKSSVYGYVALVTSVVFKQWASQAGNIAAIISATSGIVLFVLSDAQIQAWITGQKPTDQQPPTAPPPKQG